MKHVVQGLLLLSLAACAGQAGPLGSLNSGPPDTDPGCYDHKNRLERTITTAAECATMTWIWKPLGNVAGAASAPR